MNLLPIIYDVATPEIIIIPVLAIILLLVITAGLIIAAIFVVKAIKRKRNEKITKKVMENKNKAIKK